MLQGGPLAEVQTEGITLDDVFFFVALGVGLLIFAWWLLETHLGSKSLVDVPRRRTRLPFWIPFAVLLLWTAGNIIAFAAKDTAKTRLELSEAAQTGVFYAVVAGADIGLIVLMGWLGWRFFARRLRGFGLDFRRLGRDAVSAAVTLLAILPVVLGMMSVVILLGRFWAGEDFQMEENEGLTVLREHSEVWLRVVIFVYAGLVVACFEEMLFRGLFQSVIRSVTSQPWVAIISTSVLFTILHPPMHWPAMFMLSLAMGYSYEKSGSLVRAILVHVYFNTSMMVLTLSGV